MCGFIPTESPKAPPLHRSGKQKVCPVPKELLKGGRIMTKYEFLWTNAGKEAKGYATISEQKNDNGKWFVEVFCTIDSRMHKIYGADKEHASLMGRGFVLERYCDYSLKNIDETPFVI